MPTPRRQPPKPPARSKLLPAGRAPSAPTTPAEPPALADLEKLLAEQVRAYRGLAELLDEHRAALADMDLARVLKLTKDHAKRREELVRLDRRRQAMLTRLGGTGTLADLAERHPGRGKALRRLREELIRVTDDARARGKLAAGVAGGVLGHLNTAVRLLAEAAGGGAAYAKDGTRRPNLRRVVEVKA